MRWARRVGRFLGDWRTAATVLGTVLMVLLAVTVTDSIATRRSALEALTAQARQSLSQQQAATARISELRDQIASLQGDAERNGARIAELVAQVSALEEQIRQMCVGRSGCAPVVPATPPAGSTTTTTPTGAPTPTTTTTAPPAPTPTTAPPTTTPCVTLPVVGTCVGRASRGAARTDEGRLLSSTAYCLTGNMASGRPTYQGAVAANYWPLGTVLDVSDSPYGPGRFVVEDRYGSGTELDFAMPGDCAGANAWGRRTVTVTEGA